MPEVGKQVGKQKNHRQASTAVDSKQKPVTDDAIRARAYDRYVQRGGEPGHEEEDWREAERELTQGR